MTDTTGSPKPISPTPPRTVQYALYAIGAQVVLTVVNALMLWGYTSQLKALLVTANSKQPEAAVAILQFLSSADAAATITKAGLKPLDKK